MILIYEFTYISKNGTLENFLDNIARDCNMNYYINFDNEDRIFLYVEAEEDSILEFSDILSSSLPISVFLIDTKVYVGEEFDSSRHNIRECKNRFAFTPKSLKLLKENFNPFIKNEVGIDLEIKPPLTFTNKDGKSEFFDNFKDAFLLLADEIIKNGANIKTTNGTYFISLVNKENFLDVKESFLITPTDLSVIDKAFIVQKEDIGALASLEKPVINLPINLVYGTKHNYLPKFIKTRLANDKFLYLLTLVLFEKCVEFIFVSDRKDNCGILSFNYDVADAECFEVVPLENKANLIVSGFNYSSKPIIEKLRHFNDKSHTLFLSLLRESNLFDKSCCGFFLSKKYDDKIVYYNENSGVLDFVNIEYKKSINEILAYISTMDENGAKLVKNYKDAHSLYENIKDISLKEDDAQNFYNLYTLISLLLGFGNDCKSSIDKFIENFSLFTGVKGPRFDYKLKDLDNLKTSFDAYRLIRSALSYKLAGVDDAILSYGLIESLVFFISDTSDMYKDSFDVQNIALFGSMFEHRALSNLCIKHLSVNYKINFNKELPIEF